MQAPILLFKTSFEQEEDAVALSDWLDDHPSVSAWNIDLEDCDRVLRVSSQHLTITDIIDYVTRLGFHCEELE